MIICNNKTFEYNNLIGGTDNLQKISNPNKNEI